MMDISKQAVKINCPECKRTVQVTLKQVADEALVRCSCGQEIRLKDNNGSAKKSIRDINKSFQGLEDAFKKLGR
jgi:hypothetical protein